jgi:hypothetical protein
MRLSETIQFDDPNQFEYLYLEYFSDQIKCIVQPRDFHVLLM